MNYVRQTIFPRVFFYSLKDVSRHTHAQSHFKSAYFSQCRSPLFFPLNIRALLQWPSSTYHKKQILHRDSPLLETEYRVVRYCGDTDRPTAVVQNTDVGSRINRSSRAINTCIVIIYHMYRAVA